MIWGIFLVVSCFSVWKVLHFTNHLQYASCKSIVFAYYFTLIIAVYFSYVWFTFVAGKSITCIAYQLRHSYDIVYYSWFIGLTNFWNQIHCIPLIYIVDIHRQMDESMLNSISIIFKWQVVLFPLYSNIEGWAQDYSNSNIFLKPFV